MKKLNVEALLARNPQVDQERLKANEDRIRAARKLAGKKPEKPVRAPYGGSKLIVSDDDRHGIDRRRTA